MDRYTKKQMDGMSEMQFAICILQDRLNKLTNPYSPLAKKLRMTISKLDRLESQPVKVNWWDIVYTGPDGEKLCSLEINSGELERIGALVARGFSCGEICGGDGK